MNLEYVKAKEKELDEKLREPSRLQARSETLQRENDELEKKAIALRDELAAKQKAYAVLIEAMKKKEMGIEEKEKRLAELTGR